MTRGIILGWQNCGAIEIALPSQAMMSNMSVEHRKTTQR
jgi:hypothetical protein